jgi:hypothetical protein
MGEAGDTSAHRRPTMGRRQLVVGAVLIVAVLGPGCGSRAPGDRRQDPTQVGGKADVPTWLRPVGVDLACGTTVQGLFNGWDSAHLFDLAAQGQQTYSFSFTGGHLPQAGAAVAVYDAQTGERLGIDRQPTANSASLELEVQTDAQLLVGAYAIWDWAVGWYSLSVSCQPTTGPAPVPTPPQPPAVPGSIQLVPGTEAVFASQQQGVQLLTTVDDYLLALSPFDRSYMSQTEGEVTPQDFLQFLASQPVDWPPTEVQALEAVLQSVAQQLQPYALDLPPTVALVRVKGGPDLPYTRGSFIVVTDSVLQLGTADLETVMTHEVFHILSRHNPGLRQQLYAIVGFSQCPELTYPGELADLKMTNPDTPIANHAIKVSYMGQSYDVIPITYSPAPYASSMGTDPLSFVQLKLLGVQVGQSETLPLYWNGKPFALDISQVPAYIQKVGMNTQYLVHPDEILADNFVYMVQGKANLPSPQIPQQMAQILKK